MRRLVEEIHGFFGTDLGKQCQVIAIIPRDGAWEARVEALEPRESRLLQDVFGLYRVQLDREGKVTSWERVGMRSRGATVVSGDFIEEEDFGRYTVEVENLPVAPEVLSTPPKAPEDPTAERLERLLGEIPRGMTLLELERNSGTEAAEVLMALDRLMARGRVRKDGRRYLVVAEAK